METKIKYYKNYISFIHCNKKKGKKYKATFNIHLLHYVM